MNFNLSDLRSNRSKAKGERPTGWWPAILKAPCSHSRKEVKNDLLYLTTLLHQVASRLFLSWEKQLQMVVGPKAHCKTLTHQCNPLSSNALTHPPVSQDILLSGRCQMERPPWNCQLNSNPHFPTNFPRRHHQSCYRPKLFFVAKVKWKCQIPDQTETFCSSNSAKDNFIRIPK